MYIQNTNDASFHQLWSEYKRISEQKTMEAKEMKMLEAIEIEIIKRGKIADEQIKWAKDNPTDESDLKRDFDDSGDDDSEFTETPEIESEHIPI